MSSLQTDMRQLPQQKQRLIDVEQLDIDSKEFSAERGRLQTLSNRTSKLTLREHGCA